MPKVKLTIDGVPVEVEEATAPLIQKLTGDRDAAVKARLDAEAARDAAVTMAEKAKQDAEAARLTGDQLDAMVQERAALVGAVRSICGDSYQPEGKASTALRADALQALGIATEGKTPDQIAAAYEVAAQMHGKNRAQGNAQRGDGKAHGASRADAARDKFLAAQQWTPLYSQRKQAASAD